MQSTKQKAVIFIGLVILLAVSLALSFAPNLAQNAGASAPSGLAATHATSSLLAVNTTATMVFATSSCASRTITTSNLSGIMVTISDFQGAVASPTVGHWQAASTTKEWDSGQYGCGAFRVYSSASQNIYVSEVR